MMALRAGNPFYFLFSAADQALIDLSTLQIEDVAYAANPATADPYPQSLRLRFSLTTAGGTAPKLSPLGPGLLTFHADPAAGKTAPSPAQAVIANYASWPTTGRLRLTIGVPDLDAQKRLMDITGLPVVPSDLWYGPVTLTENFLFQTLPQLPVAKVIGGRTNTPTPGTPDAVKQTVSGFLKGKFSALIVSGEQASADTQSAHEMPALAPAPSGDFDFYVTAAFTAAPCDGEPGDFENANGVTDDWEPSHPKNGAIPARLVYRMLRTHASGDLIDGAPGTALADAILAPGSTATDYYPICFTRVWKRIEDRSVHFPSQVVRAEQIAAGTPYVVEQRLPVHGVLFIALDPIRRLAGTDFRISLSNPSGKAEREMWWLTGGVPNVWQDAAANVAVTVTLPPAAQALQSPPHILLRRRMSQEVLYDRKSRPTNDGAACTFFSLRRAVRALVNNRIAGGRLNFEVFVVHNAIRGNNAPATRDLVKEALAGAESAILDGKPDHTGDPEVEAPKLKPVLETLFPQVVPAQPGVGPDPGMTYGALVYWIWQSGVAKFQEAATRRAFDDAWIGGGGAGALAAMGLAVDYAVNPDQTVSRAPNESDASFRGDIVNEMLSGALQPGAALQFWMNFSDLAKIRNRTVPMVGHDPVLNGFGHSPVFVRYTGPAGNPTGMVVLDQHGESECPRAGNAGAFILQWSGANPDAWIAANWSD
jgi:hypothetical protein